MSQGNINSRYSHPEASTAAQRAEKPPGGHSQDVPVDHGSMDSYKEL